MKKILFLKLVLISLHIHAQDSNYEDKWLVILSGFKTNEEAFNNKDNYKFETKILNSSDYDNLNPGWFINCVPFETKEDAIKRIPSKKYVKF